MTIFRGMRSPMQFAAALLARFRASRAARRRVAVVACRDGGGLCPLLLVTNVGNVPAMLAEPCGHCGGARHAIQFATESYALAYRKRAEREARATVAHDRRDER